MGLLTEVEVVDIRRGPLRRRESVVQPAPAPSLANRLGLRLDTHHLGRLHRDWIRRRFCAPVLRPGSAPWFCARSPTPCHHFIFILKSLFLLQQHVASADAAGVNGHEEGGWFADKRNERPHFKLSLASFILE